MCREGVVFGGQGITWMKVRLQIREAVDKVSEGLQFFTRGIRLLGSDCNNCGRLFYRAALGVYHLHMLVLVKLHRVRISNH